MEMFLISTLVPPGQIEDLQQVEGGPGVQTQNSVDQTEPRPQPDQYLINNPSPELAPPGSEHVEPQREAGGGAARNQVFTERRHTCSETELLPPPGGARSQTTGPSGTQWTGVLLFVLFICCYLDVCVCSTKHALFTRRDFFLIKNIPACMHTVQLLTSGPVILLLVIYNH